MSTKEYLDSDGLATLAGNINTTFAKKAALTDETTARTAADTALDTRVSALEQALPSPAVTACSASYSNQGVALTVKNVSGTTQTIKHPTSFVKAVGQNSAYNNMQKYVYNYYTAQGTPQQNFSAWIPYKFTNTITLDNNIGYIKFKTTNGEAANATTTPTSIESTLDIRTLTLDIYNTNKKFDEAAETGTYVVEDGEIIRNIATAMNIDYKTMTSLSAFPFAFDFSNVTNFASMFSGLSKLTTLPSIDTSNGTDFRYMFNGCAALTTLPTIDLSALTATQISSNSSSNKLYNMVNSTGLSTVTLHHATVNLNNYVYSIKWALVGSYIWQKNVTIV